MHYTTQDRESIIASVKELFVFSPFGLGCRQCKFNASIQMDERSIAIHLKKHSIDSRIITVRCILNHYQIELQNAKAAGIIDPFRTDKKTYSGFQCICGQMFSIRKANAIRHCKKTGCNPKKLVEVQLIKLCCGRYVTQAQIDSQFTNSPRRHIKVQFNYVATRGILLPFLPLREKHDHTYTHMYTPLIAGCGYQPAGFHSKIKADFHSIHSPPIESLLLKIHEHAENWLLNFAPKNILMVPGHLRAGLQKIGVPQ